MEDRAIDLQVSLCTSVLGVISRSYGIRFSEYIRVTSIHFLDGVTCRIGICIFFVDWYKVGLVSSLQHLDRSFQ